MEFKANMEASKFRYKRWHHNYGIHLGSYILRSWVRSYRGLIPLRLLMITKTAAHLAANSDINAKTSNSEQLTAPAPLPDHGITYKCLLVGEKDLVARVALSQITRSCCNLSVGSSADINFDISTKMPSFAPLDMALFLRLSICCKSLLHWSCSTHLMIGCAFGRELNKFGSTRSSIM